MANKNKGNLKIMRFVIGLNLSDLDSAYIFITIVQLEFNEQFVIFHKTVTCCVHKTVTFQKINFITFSDSGLVGNGF